VEASEQRLAQRVPVREAPCSTTTWRCWPARRLGCPPFRAWRRRDWEPSPAASGRLWNRSACPCSPSVVCSV